jgi:hypothetical protein
MKWRKTLAKVDFRGWPAAEKEPRDKWKFHPHNPFFKEKLDAVLRRKDSGLKILLFFLFSFFFNISVFSLCHYHDISHSWFISSP